MKTSLVLGLLLLARPALAERTLASIWLDRDGQAIHAGRRYQLVDRHGKPVRLPPLVALSITESAEANPSPGAVPRAPLSLTLPVTGQALGADGRAYTLSGTVNLTVGEVPIPIPQPSAVVVTMVIDAGGASVTQAAGGSLVGIRGTGFGAGGTVKVAGQAVAVLDWNPTSILAKLPVVTAVVTGPVVVAPAGQEPGASAFGFAILSGPAPTPVPGPVPIPDPLPQPVGDEWPAGSGIHWQQDASGYHQPVGAYPWALPGHAGLAYPYGQEPPWASHAVPEARRKVRF